MFDKTFVCYVSNALIFISLQALVLIIKRHEVTKFIKGFERFINKSGCNIFNNLIMFNDNCFFFFTEIELNETKVFFQTESVLTKVSRIFLTLGYVGTVFYCCLPGITIIYAIATDSVTSQTYLAPFKDLYTVHLIHC